MVRRTGEAKRPQIVFVGFTQDDPAYRAMAAMSAHSEVVEPDAVQEWTQRVRTAEWDVLVSRESSSASHVPSHMFVFEMGGRSTGSLVQRSPGPHGIASARSYWAGGVQPSKHLSINTELEPPALQRLVDRDLVPWLEGQDKVPFLIGRAVPATAAVEDELTGPHFVLDADRHVVAGHFRRAQPNNVPANGWCLTLPFVPDEPALWLRAILDVWRDTSPQRFADLPVWWEGDNYRTVAEVHALEALAELDEDHAASVRAFEVARQQLQVGLLAAEADAAAGLRQLLTEQGGVLVQAVQSALEFLGFAVVDADAEKGAGVAKLEDLRVSDPEHSGWTNITEVKGYTGGAKTRDLLAMERFASAYRMREETYPTSRWYLVNHFLSDPPDGRPPCLQGGDEDVALFAQDGGLVIDTRELFALVRHVAFGSIDKSLARKLLREATGHFTLPVDDRP